MGVVARCLCEWLWGFVCFWLCVVFMFCLVFCVFCGGFGCGGLVGFGVLGWLAVSVCFCCFVIFLFVVLGLVCCVCFGFCLVVLCFWFVVFWGFFWRGGCFFCSCFLFW